MKSQYMLVQRERARENCSACLGPHGGADAVLDPSLVWAPGLIIAAPCAWWFSDFKFFVITKGILP